MFTPKNIPLLIGIALPIIFIVVISAIIFIPTLFIKPQYNFLYSTDDSSYNYPQQYLNTYAVAGNHLVLQALPPASGVTYKNGNPTLFLYDVKTNTTHQIDFDEAKNLTIDAGPSSPDGYIVRYQYSNDGIFELFGSNGNQNGYAVAKGNSSKKLDGLNGTYYNSGTIKFIGWVK